ncbi:MAG: hypothetical protein RPR91_03185 [Colwellia sp.]|jgi:hypothetical protein
MIANVHHKTVIDENLKKLIFDIECMGDSEVVAALAMVIERCSQVIAKKTGADHAQCVLYNSYIKFNKGVQHASA